MKDRFNNLSIDRKLSLVILCISVSVLLLAGAAMIGTEVLTARRAMMEDMSVLADLLGRNSSAPLLFHREDDADELTTMLSALAADRHVLLACVYDKDDALFAKYSAKVAQSPSPERTPVLGARFETGFAEIALPIDKDGRRIGTIYVRSDLYRIYRPIVLHGAIIALILLAIIVMTFALSPSLRRPISEPILALADLARRVAGEKNYSVRATKRSNDEVGLLTDAFNQMLGEIEAGQSSLERANQSMYHEIEERKLIEEQLRHASRELATAKDIAEAASRAKDQFLAILSHELRTPLTPVLLTVALLRAQKNLPDEVRQDIETIGRHVELEARLIDDLLDLTRITRGKLQLNLERVDIHVLLRDALQICCSNRMGDVNAEFNATQSFVRADSGRLLQVFWNLLNNSAKYTPVGKSITVRTSNFGANKVRIEVIDQGVGISAEALTHIFDAFHQGTGDRRLGGLGLGLTIARALVLAHGGTIEAQSEGVDRGTAFTIELQTIGAATDVVTTPSPTVDSAALSGRTAPLRLLLVEDHEGTLNVISRLLTQAGHEVKGAATVRDALELAKNEKIDLVISDVGLPDGSGLDLIRELRSQYGIKGIGLSGFGMDEDIARGREAGFSEYLTKPVDIDELERAIQSVASR